MLFHYMPIAILVCICMASYGVISDSEVPLYKHSDPILINVTYAGQLCGRWHSEHLQDASTKLAKNKRDNFRLKAKKFFLKGDQLFRFIPGNIQGAKVVLKDEVRDILQEFHGSAFGGHSGVNKTREAINSRYWWFGLTDDVKNYIRSCEACQKSDPLKPAKKPDLQQIKVSSPFELVGVDLVGPLTETTQGNKYIFTATDYYTKWVEAFPIPSKDATVVAKCFRKLFSRHGAVNAILTDQGREFLNKINDQLCQEWNIKHKVTAAYHPQTNGLDERTNQTLKATLRKVVNEHQTDWDDYLDGALFAQRTKPQASTKYSPFFLLYGREAIYPSQLSKDFGGEAEIPNQPTETDLDEYTTKRQQNTQQVSTHVTTNIQKAQQKQKTDYKKRSEKGRQHHTFNVGDTVLVFNARKTATRKGNLQPNYTGPYTIVSLLGKSVMLQNASKQLLKKKFNIDHLKLFHPADDNEEQLTRRTSDSVSCQPVSIPATSTSNTASYTSTSKHTDIVQTYIDTISNSGELKDLIAFVSELHLTKPSHVYDLHKLLMECPLQSFVAEVSKDAEEMMDAFGSLILPHIRHMTINLTAKTTLTMLLACVCAKATQLSHSVMTIAETLRAKPGHLLHDILSPSHLLKPSERLSVGGETIEAVDLETLDPGKWLNDKIINSFLGLLKSQHNLNSTEDHIFVLPSYTAVLWNEGNIDHWMFTKVQFSKFKHILMPVNVNGNHWVLLAANTGERTVMVYDSMHGQDAEKWVTLWRRFMQVRDSMTDISEQFGLWHHAPGYSSKQTDGSSCGVFTLMNAECVIKGIPIQVMRQVHCKMYREYIRAHLLQAGTVQQETLCDMPDCNMKQRVCRWVQCCVCGRWFHTKCCGLSTKSAIEENFECCFCIAMYR